MGSPSYSPDQITVFIVNDQAFQLVMLSGLLEEENYGIRAFESAEAALNAMNPARPPDLIVTDLFMPGIDGWKFCRLLRSPEYQAFNAVPILVVSATFSGDETDRITMDLGADGFLPLPVDRDRFSARVRDLIQGARRRDPLRVLIVEDSRSLADVLKQTFDAHGYRCDIAETAREAEERFAENACQVAVIDYHLPDREGDTLLERFQGAEAGCVCIMMTVDSRPELALKWMKMGAAAYLRKPFEPDYLLEVCAKTRRERSLLRTEVLLEDRTRALREREAFYRALLDGINDAVWIHRIGPEGLPGSLVEVNPAACALLEYEREDLLCMNPCDLMPPEAFEGFAGIREAIATHGRAVFETLLLTRGGRGVPVENHLRVFEHAGEKLAVCVSRDITERKRREAEIVRKSRERRLLLDTIPVQIWYLSDEETYGVVNRARAEFLGYHPKDLAYQKTRDFLPPESERTCREGAREAFRTRQPVRTEEWVSNARGEPRLLRVTRTPKLTPEGDVEYLVCAAVDVTDRRRAEEALRRRLRYEKGIAEASACLLRKGSGRDNITDALARLCESAEVGRVYIFENIDDPANGLCMRQVYESCAPGVSPQVDNPVLERVPYQNGFERWLVMLSNGGIIQGVVADFPQPERLVLEPQGIRSILVLPLFVNGKWRGFIGFDDTRSPRRWKREDIRLLKTASERIGGYMAGMAAEAAVQESEARLRTVVQNMPVLMDAFDETGKIIAWNRECERVTGYQASEILEHPNPLALLYPGAGDLARIEAEWAGFGSEIHDWELELTCKDGSCRTIAWSNVSGACPIPGWDSWAVGVDVTELKRAEADRRRLDRQLSQMEKAESLSRMAGAIAHHCNNMLGAAMGNLEILLEDVPETSPCRPYAEAAMQASRRAAEVSGMMLTYLGQTPGRPAPLDLADLVRRYGPRLRSLFSEGGIPEFDLPEPGPVVNAVPDQIHQILRRLVENARESYETGRPAVRVTIKSVPAGEIPESHRFPVDWRPEGSAYACLEVADTGSGIAAQDMDRIFDPFFSTKFTGRGLGLAAVLGIATAHGGAVAADSEPGRGSRFRVFLPVSNRTPPRRMEPAASAPDAKGYGTVLLVEDEPTVRTMARALLERLGYQVIEAEGGEQAVAVFSEYGPEIRCVLCDLTMPGMDGWQTLTAIRKRAPGVPVILTSGYDEARVFKGAYPENPQAFLAKPFGSEDLKAALKKAVGETG